MIDWHVIVMEGGFSLVGKDHMGFGILLGHFELVLAVLGLLGPVLARFAPFSGPWANGAILGCYCLQR